MKVFGFLALAGLTSALPWPQSESDLEDGPCKEVTFIFARASGETGNIGGSMGPQVCNNLKRKFPRNVACQGVGGRYTASLIDNVLPAGTTGAAIREATDVFETAFSKCPATKIVAGGYSQGSALMNAAVSQLPEASKSKILGVVLFGYTKNLQNGGKIEDFPRNKVKTYCSLSDGVCGGALLVTPGHFVYVANGDGADAAEFLARQIRGAGGGDSDD